MFNGKTAYFYGHVQVRKLLVYQRVTMKPWYKLQYLKDLFPTANLWGFNLWCRGLVTKKCMPRKTGTVLEPCWNLSLLGCKAGQMEIMIICISRTTNNIIEDSATTYGEVPQT